MEPKLSVAVQEIGLYFSKEKGLCEAKTKEGDPSELVSLFG
jgi:hypothetical protein